MSAEQLVRIYYASLTQKPKIVDRTKLDKDKKRKDKRENMGKGVKYKPMNKADIEAKRQKFKDQQRNKNAPYIKDDRKRKYDKGYNRGYQGDHPRNPENKERSHDYDRSHDYGKNWRHDDGQARPSAPY